MQRKGEGEDKHRSGFYPEHLEIRAVLHHSGERGAAVPAREEGSQRWQVSVDTSDANPVEYEAGS